MLFEREARAFALHSCARRVSRRLSRPVDVSYRRPTVGNTFCSHVLLLLHYHVSLLTKVAPDTFCTPPHTTVFLILGVLCGLLGAAFIFWHRRVVELRRQSEDRFAVFKRSRYIYVCMVAVVIACSTYPGTSTRRGVGDGFQGGVAA